MEKISIISVMNRSDWPFHYNSGSNVNQYIGSKSNPANLTVVLEVTTPHEGSGQVLNSSHPRSLTNMVALGLPLATVNLLTILGNLLVCVTILSFRRLQNPTNYFILSLALSDLLLGCLVLPFSTVVTVIESWPLGVIFCNLYVSTDVMLCTVSILNLFAISLDRYFAITVPLRYQQQATGHKVAVVLAVIWFFSFCMAFLPIHLGLNTEDGSLQNSRVPHQCTLEGNAVYVLLVALGTYFIPLLVMCGVYVRVFRIAHEQVKRINQLASCGAIRGKEESHKDRRTVSDAKATFTLASVVLAFTICWVPYFVLFIARPFVTTPFPPALDLFCLWLGYVNSLLNPFLYAFHNSELRWAFLKILCRGFSDGQSTLTQEAYYV